LLFAEKRLREMEPSEHQRRGAEQKQKKGERDRAVRDVFG
jgi:hypothetical protein